MSDETWTETHKDTLERWVASFGGENWADTAAAIKATRAALAEIARLQEELNAQVLKAHAANSNYRQVAEQLEALQNDVREERT